MDGKICQNIKTLTPTGIPSSLQLSTWGRLDDYATNSFYILYVNSQNKI